MQRAESAGGAVLIKTQTAIYHRTPFHPPPAPSSSYSFLVWAPRNRWVSQNPISFGGVKSHLHAPITHLQKTPFSFFYILLSLHPNFISESFFSLCSFLSWRLLLRVLMTFVWHIVTVFFSWRITLNFNILQINHSQFNSGNSTECNGFRLFTCIKHPWKIVWQFATKRKKALICVVRVREQESQFRFALILCAISAQHVFFTVSSFYLSVSLSRPLNFCVPVACFWSPTVIGLCVPWLTVEKRKIEMSAHNVLNGHAQIEGPLTKITW